MRLTPRQTEVLKAIAKGQTDKEIARALQLSPRTVEMHVAAVLKGLACASRAEAFEQPVAVGGQQVLPDDHVLADRDGVILIGAAEVEAVVAAAERKMATEGDMVRAIRAGEDPQAA